MKQTVLVPDAIVPEGLGHSQARIVELLQKEPGATIQSLADRIGISHASGTYALNQLQRKGLVVQRRDGRTKLNFLASARSDADGSLLGPLLAEPRKRQLAELLVEQMPSQRTVNWLAQRIGASHSFVFRCTTLLASGQFVAIDRTGDRRYVRAEPKLAARLLAWNSQSIDPARAGPGEAEATVAPMAAAMSR